jgi:hypothetical protein
MSVFETTVFRDYLPSDELPESLAKAKAALEADPLREDEDAIRGATKRAFFGKAAVADGGRTLDKLFGSQTELDAVRARLEKKAGSDTDLTAEGIRHRALVKTLLGEEIAEVEPIGDETVDPTWHQPVISKIIGAASSREALARDQRPARGEPRQHADGEVVEEWPDGRQSWTYRDGKIIRSKIQYETDDGVVEMEFFGADGNEITGPEYTVLA